jgi:hypothetical protein
VPVSLKKEQNYQAPKKFKEANRLELLDILQAAMNGHKFSLHMLDPRGNYQIAMLPLQKNARTLQEQEQEHEKIANLSASVALMSITSCHDHL